MRRLILIAFGLLFTLYACQKSKCWKGYGNDLTEERLLADFHTIEVYDNLNLVFIPSPHRKATIVSSENLVPFIHTDIKDGVLTITDDNKCDFIRGYDKKRTVYIKGPSINHLICFNSGDVSITDTVFTNYFTFEQWSASGNNEIIVKADTVDIKLHTGTGDITASGTCKQLFLYASSYGFSDCYDLETVGAWVTVRSTNNAYINTTRRLNAFIQSSANIYVRGNPDKVFLERSGTGKLIYE